MPRLLRTICRRTASPCPAIRYHVSTAKTLQAMANLLYYWAIEPIRGGISDDGKRAPVFETTLVVKGTNYVFGLYCDDDNMPWFARVVIPDVQSAEIPAAALPLLTMLPQYLMSILRLIWRPDVRLVPIKLCSLQKKGSSQGATFRLEMPNVFPFQAQTAKALFQYAIGFREEFLLFADGLDEHIPLQYRYLAFYKLLEKRFKEGKKWNDAALDQALGRYKEQLRGIKLQKSVRNELQDIRDRCAHIYTGNNKRKVLGITTLSHRDVDRVSAILPILQFVCRDIINSLANGKFSLPDDCSWQERFGLLVVRKLRRG